MIAMVDVEKYLVVEVEECLIELPAPTAWEAWNKLRTKVQSAAQIWIEGPTDYGWAGIE